MEVSFSDSFKKVYKKRVKSTEIEEEFWIRLELFVNDLHSELAKRIYLVTK